MWDRLDQLGRALDAHVDELTALDSVAGDGDLGTTAQVALRAVAARVDDIRYLPMDEQLTKLGRILASEAASTSGTLLAFGFLGAGKAAIPEASGAERLAGILDALAAAIAAKGSATLGDKTMLDALFPAAEAAAAAAGRGLDLEDALIAAAAAARAGAERTTVMTPKFGRAAWLADRSAGSVDAGARLVEVMLSGLCSSDDGHAQ